MINLSFYNKEKWVNDNLLWDIMSLSEEIYSSFVLSIHPQQLIGTIPTSAPSTSNNYNDMSVGDGNNLQTKIYTVPFHCDIPRQLLLSNEFGVTVEYLQSLETQLMEGKVCNLLFILFLIL